jgi:hypothetical protein
VESTGRHVSTNSHSISVPAAALERAEPESKAVSPSECEMNLTRLEEHVLAYFLSVEALGFSVDGRFYRREEFVQVFEDRIFFTTPGFDDLVQSRHPKVASYLVDILIEEKALSTANDQWTGVSHRFDPGRYKVVVNELIKSNIICQRAQEAGPRFWAEAFATLNE